MDADTQTLTPMPDGFCWKPRCCSGRAARLMPAGGCELLALRHEQPLRRKVAKKRQWIQDNGVLRGREEQLDPADVLSPPLSG